MDTVLLKEVLTCLDGDRRLMHYYKDRYALYLLYKWLGEKEACRLSELKSSKLAKLFNKEQVKNLVADCGNGWLKKKQLADYFYWLNYQSFTLTLSEWGADEDYYWSQTSRPGSNLVLQLNFTNEHDRLMKKHKLDGGIFKYCSHPVHTTKNTMAWARIDFDFASGEALIEEIQNDWLRSANWYLTRSKNILRQGRQTCQVRGVVYQAKDMMEYTAGVLAKYYKLWNETLLFAAIMFIKEDLGLDKIYYHDFETGCVLKNIRDCRPPKSLYTDLPKKFCFSQTDCGPAFIVNNRKVKRRMKKVKQPKWFVLEI